MGNENTKNEIEAVTDEADFSHLSDYRWTRHSPYPLRGKKGFQGKGKKRTIFPDPAAFKKIGCLFS
ncbi:MAG: hypothetical protein U9P50_02765 [Patescibacteria group bacterium]|nr:hypothetical protein [Patescibacteria group bacterium]